MVTTTADSGPGSLRDAINQIIADTSHVLYASPSNPSVDEIDFAITAASDTGGGFNSATGVATITPLSQLPTVTNAVLINGYTQAGAKANDLSGPGPLGQGSAAPSTYGDDAVLKIELDGENAGNATGLYLTGNNITVQGLVINRFASDGIYMSSTGASDVIQGNFLGTDVTGTQALGNSGADVFVQAANVTIGGTVPGDRNIISGALASGTLPGYGIILVGGGSEQVAGNFIGTDVTGTQPLGNALAGIYIDSGPVLIGGFVTGAGNVISGNFDGIRDQNSSGNAFQGNFIGTDVTGTKALPNSSDGIFGINVDSETYGGPGAGNLISGNIGDAGIRFYGNNNVFQGNLIGTDVTGTKSLSNTYGILDQDGGNNNIIGGTDPGDRNVISGDGDGIALKANASGASGNVVEGNYIGTDITGTQAIGNNGPGVFLGVNAINNTIGGTTAAAQNIISGNGTGVFMGLNGNTGPLPTGNSILGNSIYYNDGQGIDLVNGANDNQAAPVLTAAYAPSGATIALGTITTTPNATVRVEFFANAAGDPEGQTLLGSQSVTTDASGHGSFTAFLSAALPAGQGLVTATVTDLNGNTSEFSAGVTATPLPPSSQSGVVWEDFNDDGQVDFGENGIGGVTITLTGTDFLGNAVNLSQTTDGDGAYVFLNLLPGSYYLTETPPAGYPQGIDSVGTAGGSVSATDQFFVALGPGVDGLNYNFGELPPAGGKVRDGQTAGIGFWNNKRGQALIKAPQRRHRHPARRLAGGHPAQHLRQERRRQRPGRPEQRLHRRPVPAGLRDEGGEAGRAGAGHGAGGLRHQHDPRPDEGGGLLRLHGQRQRGGYGDDQRRLQRGRFGVANNTRMTLMDLLLATDAQAVNGVLYNGNKDKRNDANDVYSAVNEAGDNS